MGFIPEPAIRSLNKIEGLNTWIHLISGISTMFRSWKDQCCLKWDVINQVWSNINAILAWAREVICEQWQQEATSQTPSFEGKAACVQTLDLALRKQVCKWPCPCLHCRTRGSLSSRLGNSRVAQSGPDWAVQSISAVSWKELAGCLRALVFLFKAEKGWE